MRLGIAVILALAAIEAGTQADEGRIPLYQTTTIDKAGSYVLTRDIEADQVIFSIVADGVDIDLNGFSLRADSGDLDVVQIGGVPTGEGVRIFGGTIVGGKNGIACVEGQQQEEPYRLHVHDVRISRPVDAGILCDNAGEIRVERAEIDRSATGIALAGLVGYRASLIDNVIADVSGSGIALSGANGAVIRGNRVLRYGGAVSTLGNGAGIWMRPGSPGSSGNLIVDNQLQSGQGLADGISLVGTFNSLVDRNVVSDGGGFGMVLNGSHYRATRNVVSGHARSGIFAAGAYGTLERNSSQGNSEYGLTCGGLGPYFRGNMLIVNTLGSLDGGAGVCDFSVDLGENVR